MIIEKLVAQLGYELDGQGDLRRFQDGLSEAARSVGRAASEVGGKMQSIGKGLMASITAPIVGLGTASFAVGAEFEHEMSKIVGLVGVAREEVESWKADLVDLSRETGIGLDSLGKAMFFITSAGQRGTTALNTLRASAQASAAGLGEIEAIADAATSAMNAYGEENLSADKAIGILVGTIREGKLETSQLASSISQVIPTASELGVRFDEVGAALAVMSRTGTNASQGATNLNAVLSKLIRPSEQARKTLEEYGLTIEKVRDQLREEGLIATLRSLKDAFGGNTEAMAKVFEDVNAFRSVLQLVGGDVETTEAIFSSLANETGASLVTAFKAVSGDASMSLRRAMASIQAALVKLSDVIIPKVVPVINGFADAVSRLSDAFGELDPETQDFIFYALAIAAALGPALFFAGIAVSTFGKLIPVAVGLAKAFVALRAAAGGLGWLALILAGLGLIVAGAVENWEKVSAAFKELAGGVIDYVANALKALGAVLRGDFAGAGEALLKVWNGIYSAIKGVGDLLASLGEGMVKVIDGLLPGFKDLGFQIADAIRGAIDEMFKAGGELITALWEGMKAKVAEMIDWVADIGGQIVDGFLGNIEHPYEKQLREMNGGGEAAAPPGPWDDVRVHGQTHDQLVASMTRAAQIEVAIGNLADRIRAFLSSVSVPDLFGFGDALGLVSAGQFSPTIDVTRNVSVEQTVNTTINQNVTGATAPGAAGSAVTDAASGIADRAADILSSEPAIDGIGPARTGGRF